MQRNPYWPPNGPSFFSVLRFRRFVFSPCQKGKVGFEPTFAARVASRHLRRMNSLFPWCDEYKSNGLLLK